MMKVLPLVSKGEAAFELHCRAMKLAFVREHRFDPKRRWRFDFAFPDQMVAVEIEGGVWTGGRHTRGKGYAADLEKYNAAALAGWRVFRFTTEQAVSGAAAAFVAPVLRSGGDGA